MAWTDEKITGALLLWSHGVSVSRIAHHTGVTPGAVALKFRRMRNGNNRRMCAADACRLLERFRSSALVASLAVPVDRQQSHPLLMTAERLGQSTPRATPSE